MFQAVYQATLQLPSSLTRTHTP